MNGFTLESLRRFEIPMADFSEPLGRPLFRDFEGSLVPESFAKMK